MRYTVTRSVVYVIGKIWMPPITAAMEYTVRPDDLKNESDEITRESVERWINLNTGDFQSIIDWKADISFDETDILFDWKSDESEITYNDCVYGREED